MAISGTTYWVPYQLVVGIYSYLIFKFKDCSGLGSANEIWHHIVMSSLIGWAQFQMISEISCCNLTVVRGYQDSSSSIDCWTFLYNYIVKFILIIRAKKMWFHHQLALIININFKLQHLINTLLFISQRLWLWSLMNMFLNCYKDFDCAVWITCLLTVLKTCVY